MRCQSLYPSVTRAPRVGYVRVFYPPSRCSLSLPQFLFRSVVYACPCVCVVYGAIAFLWAMSAPL